MDLNGATNSVTGTAGKGEMVSTQYCGNCTLDHNTALNYPPNNAWQAALGAVANDLSFTYTNNIAYGSINSPPLSPGATVAGLPGATWGGNLFVGDTWPLQGAERAGCAVHGQ